MYLQWCLCLVHYDVVSFQCLWRCHAAEPPFKSSATWKVHIEEKRHFDKHHPGFSKLMNHSLNKLNSKQNSNSMSRITQKSSLLKKRRGFSRSASISDRQGSCQSIPECPEKTSPDQICKFNVDLTYIRRLPVSRRPKIWEFFLEKCRLSIIRKIKRH